MKRLESLTGFAFIYLSLIILIFLINNFLFSDGFTVSSSGILVISVGQASLTNFNYVSLNNSIYGIYIIWNILVTQLAGLIILTYALWLYRRCVYASDGERSLKRAFILTLKISLIAELLLLTFFFYALPIQLANESFINKTLAALSLAIGAFNNAGFLLSEKLLISEAIQSSFVIQIGIIAGSTAGHLGIFVIDELLSPRNLKVRLKNPNIDWSLITKVNVFGTAVILIVFSGIFYILESGSILQDKNIVESIIASAFEITSYRGLGETLFVSNYSTLKYITSIFGSGPFSTGGGFTMIFFLWLYAAISGKKLSTELDIFYRIGKNLLVYTLISFGVLAILFLLFHNSSPAELGLLWSVFTTNRLPNSGANLWSSDILLSLTNALGRIGFIVACFLALKNLRNASNPI